MKSTEIQEGLYLLETPFTVSGVTYIRRELCSDYGYHFYNVQQPENYDEKGNLLSLNKLSYSTYASLAAYYTSPELINKDFISVKEE